MYITIDETDPRPIYRQIADEIKALIARGELAEGAPLLSVRELAANLGLNLNTIATAYRELQAEGLVTIRHGTGATVASSKAHNKSAAELRKPLRAALTTLVLSGLPRAQIMGVVRDELGDLLKGVR
jgi:DNA-binding transcriptional regulator YhcF (GntR family)